MERQLWKEIVALLRRFDKEWHDPRCVYRDVEIVETWFWAVLHDRSVSWACSPDSWPKSKKNAIKPAPATMSRRLRCDGVIELLKRIEQQLLTPRGRMLQWF